MPPFASVLMLASVSACVPLVATVPKSIVWVGLVFFGPGVLFVLPGHSLW